MRIDQLPVASAIGNTDTLPFNNDGLSKQISVGNLTNSIRDNVYGAPLTASTSSAMTDTSRVYVYTGTTGGGFTNGHWYYYNGSAWTDGGTYNSAAVQTDPTLTLEGVPADAKATGEGVSNANERLTQIGNDLRNENIYTPGTADIYTIGAGTQYLYFLMDGNNPVLIPKGSVIAGINFVNASTVSHAVAIYFFERQGWNFKCVKIVGGLSIDNDRLLDINEPAFDTDVYIGIKNENEYGIRYFEDVASNVSGGVLALYNGAPSVGDVITANRDTTRTRSYNVKIDILLPESRDDNCYSGNNTFLFKGSDITSEIEWITGKGFIGDTFDTATTVSNYHYLMVNSTVGDASEPIPIRDNTGNLINNIEVNDVTQYQEAYLVAEFDRNGVYLRALTAGTFKTDGFSSDCHYAVLRKYNNYGTRYTLANPHIKWLSEKEEYTVGANGDFTTFTEMLIALENNANPKTVYVNEGVYDIYNEMGGDAYLATITNPESLNWRDVCHIVPDNTDIIGIGKVVLKWEPSASAVGSDAMAFLFSPINLSGSASLENIEVQCTNCRYAIHDEISSFARWKNVNRRYKNVYAKHLLGTYHPTQQVYGAGIAPTGKYEFENCIFEGDGNWFHFSMHGTDMGENDKTVVNIRNCIIRDLNSMTVRTNGRPIVGFGNVWSAQRYIDVNIDGCWIGGIVRKYAEGDVTGITNAFKLTMIGNNAIVVESTTQTDVLETIKCNEFSN